MAVCTAGVARWAAVSTPGGLRCPRPLCHRCPRPRQTAADLACRLAGRSFLAPTAALAAATAALSVGVGFLPVSGAAAGLGTVATAPPCPYWPPRSCGPQRAVPSTPDD